MNFQDVMICIYQEEEEAFLHEINENGARFYNSRYEVIINRINELETHLRKRFPDSIFYAYHTNEYEEDEPAIDVFCQVNEKNHVISFDIFKIEDGKLSIACATYKNEHFDDRLDRVLAQYPQLDKYVVNFIKNLPEYRLLFVTQDIEITHY